MPVIVSTNCTISRAEAVRVSRNSSCDRTWNQRVSAKSGTREPSSTSPETQSSETNAIATNSM